MSDYKSTLLPLLISTGVLSFGTYTLKSGRTSPYFFTSTKISTTRLLHAFSSAFVDLLSSPPFIDATTQKPTFDVLFGPAYKGIPFAAAVATELGVRDEKLGLDTFADVGYAFNRKEAKTHGEAGSLCGAELKGKRVLIIDDVITAGTALREAVQIIENAGGEVAGVVVLLDREERMSETEERSAIRVAESALGEGKPIRAVLRFGDLIERLEGDIGVGEIQRLKEYREKYQAIN